MVSNQYLHLFGLLKWDKMGISSLQPLSYHIARFLQFVWFPLPFCLVPKNQTPFLVYHDLKIFQGSVLLNFFDFGILQLKRGTKIINDLSLCLEYILDIQGDVKIFSLKAIVLIILVSQCNISSVLRSTIQGIRYLRLFLEFSHR